MSDPIFFAHANGFPSATYGKLFAGLAPDYAVEHLTLHGHDPRFPVGNNWQALVEELLHHLQARAEPVWGVGHSLGGLVMRAAGAVAAVGLGADPAGAGAAPGDEGGPRRARSRARAPPRTPTRSRTARSAR